VQVIFVQSQITINLGAGPWGSADRIVGKVRAPSERNAALTEAIFGANLAPSEFEIWIDSTTNWKPPPQLIPYLFATSTRWLTRRSSLASLFDLLERRHILLASGLFADRCLTTTPPLYFTPSQNIQQSLQKWRDRLEHLHRTINWWEWFGASCVNIEMTIKLWGCGKATLNLTMIDASHSLSECRIRVNSTTNRKSLL